MHKNKDINFADWLKSIVSKNGLSQVSISRSTDCTEGAVCLWLSGNRLPNVHSRIKLALHIAGVMVQPYETILQQMLWSIHISEAEKAEKKN